MTVEEILEKVNQCFETNEDRERAKNLILALENMDEYISCLDNFDEN